MKKAIWNILVVDDDEEEFVLVRSDLRETAASQAHLDWAPGFVEGLQALAGKRYDAVLVDYHMAGEDGLSFIRSAVRAGHQVPFILLTGDSRYDLDLAAMEVGAADFLAKTDVNPGLLERTLRYAIERHRLEAENNEQKQRFQSVFEVNPNGLAVVTGDDMCIQIANSAYRQLTPDPGCDPSGRSFADIWAPLAGFTGLAGIRQVIETGQVVQPAQQSWRYPDGAQRSLAFHLQPHTWQGRPAVLVTMWETTALEEARARAEQAALAATHSAAAAEEAAAEAERRALEAEEGRRTLEAILSYLPEALIIAEGPAATLRMVSEHHAELSGLARERVIGLSALEYSALLQPHDRDGANPILPENFPLARAAFSGEVIQNEEITLRPPDGRKVLLSCNAAPIRDAGGEITGSMIAMRDITESRRLETALRASESRFRGIFDANVIPLVMWHADGRVLDANDAYLNLVGFTRQEMRDGLLLWTELTPPEFIEADRRAIDEMSIGQPATPYEKAYQLRNGRRVPVLYGGAMLGDYGDRGWAFAVDLTERKQVEQAFADANAALSYSNQRLSEVLDSITDAYVALDREWRYTAVNPAAERLIYHGRKAEDLIGKVLWEEYPATRGTPLEEHLLQAASAGKAVTFESFSVVAQRWFEMHAYPREGGIELFLRDIDDRKRYEQRLAYHARLLENVHDAIIATDEEFRITAWNRAAEELYGWQEEEVTGRQLSEVLRAQITPAVLQRAVASLAERGSYRLEIAQFTRDGRRIVVESSMITLRAPNGDISGYINANRDATERIQAGQERERLLRQVEQQQARLSAIITNAPVGIMVVDNQARILMANPVGERLLARPVPYGEDYHSHARFHICYPGGEAFAPRDLPPVRSALDGETFENLEIQAIGVDGQRRDWLINSAPIVNQSGQAEGAVAIFQDITERRRAAELIQRNAAQIEIQRYLSRAREQERLNIAHDLHDGPLQEMIGLSFQLSEGLSLAEGGALSEQLQGMQNQVQQLIREMRAFCNELRPPALTPFGLERAIRSHADTYQTNHPELQLELDLEHDGQALPEPVRVTLFQVYRESLNNIHKHAQATRVKVRFALEDELAVLQVRDDGQGFHLPGHWVEFARQGHLGLVGMQERAEAVGGRVQVISNPGAGTELLVTVPYRQNGALDDPAEQPAEQPAGQPAEQPAEQPVAEPGRLPGDAVEPHTSSRS